MCLLPSLDKPLIGWNLPEKTDITAWFTSRSMTTVVEWNAVVSIPTFKTLLAFSGALLGDFP